MAAAKGSVWLYGEIYEDRIELSAAAESRRIREDQKYT
jgi:hypothetical protein